MVGGLIAIVLVLSTHPAYAQQLAITAPQSGTQYHTGDTFTVQINQPAGGPVVVGGDSHFKISPSVINQAPYAFTVTLPASLTAGDYQISATGLAPANSSISTTVTIHVEPSGSAVTGGNLSTSPKSIRFQYPGQPGSVSVYLNSNGTMTNVSYSGQLTAVSGNAAIVTANGATLTAGSTLGTTSVQYSLGGTAGSLTVYNFFSGIRGDLNGDGIVDLGDLAIIQAALNTPANGPNDARDLNHDGKIDALDARILVTLCTFPRCAAHP